MAHYSGLPRDCEDIAMAYDWKGEETARRQEVKIAVSVAVVTLVLFALIPLFI